ncbi:MAG: 2,3-dihydroxybiphenyl 1,2-dioxygenase, partial [Marmoricola sp.]
MIEIKSLGYIRVSATDLEQWRHFAEKVLGFAAARGPNPDHLYYRID